MPPGTRLWFAAAVVAALGAGVIAGRELAPAPERPPTYLEQLTRMLNLRPDQVAGVEAILSAEDREVDGWLAESLEGLSERVAERRRLTEEQLLETLDATQRARYAALVAGEQP
jgi:hypothetical protein